MEYAESARNNNNDNNNENENKNKVQVTSKTFNSRNDNSSQYDAVDEPLRQKSVHCLWRTMDLY